MNAALGQFHHRLDRVACFCVNNVGRTKSPRQFKLGIEHIDCDDARRTTDERAVDDRQADAAAADDRNRAACLNRSRVEGCPGAGSHTAANKCGPVERHVLANFHERVFMDQHVLGK